MSRRWAFVVAAPLAASILTILISTITLIAFGSDPIEAYANMLRHASKLETQVDIANRATPFYLSGIAAAIGFRMNLFNIGVEGQYLLAGLMAAQVGGLIDLPQALHILVVLGVSMLVGAAYSGLAGALKVTRGINEVISTIMLNFIAVSGIIAWGIRAWQADTDGPLTSADLGTTVMPESNRLPTVNGAVELVFREIGQGKRLTGMVGVAIVIGIAYHIVVNRTRFGFDLRATGINPFASQAGGVSSKRMIVSAMVLSGAVAGLVGMPEVMDIGKFRPNQIQGLGFAGIAVALLGRNHPVGVAFAAVLFAFLDVSSGILQSTKAASREIVVIMQGIVLLTSVVAYEVTRRLKEREEAKATAAALARNGSAA